MRIRSHLATAALLASLAATACSKAEVADEAQPADNPGPGELSLADLRVRMAKYKSVDTALAEGYIRDPANLCDEATMMGRPASAGAMGIHFFRPDLLGITGTEPRVDGTGIHTDFAQPAVLIYEPQANGTLELVAVENLVFIAAWKAAGRTDIPTFHGVPFDLMEDNPATEIDEAHMFAPHYDRHVWIYRDNPSGVFSMFNPAVNCQHHTGGGHEHSAMAN